MWRVLETLAVWLVIIGLFAGMLHLSSLGLRDGIVRLDQTLRQPDGPITVATLDESVAVPGVDPAVRPADGVVEPRWLVLPHPRYPLAEGRMVEGAVDLGCTVDEAGLLRDCTVIEETPEEHGFGAAALEAATRARLSPRTIDGEPQLGKVRFSVRFAPHKA